MNRILTQSFFQRNVVEVAEDLIGCYLVREIDNKEERYVITETEAYDGCEDLACHASKGRTTRTEVMFGEAGHIYIYLIYGMYWMLNIVTGEKDYPAAVLIRGVEDVNGPGRLTKRLQINKNLNGKALGKESGLWIEKSDKDLVRTIEKSARVGVDYAGPIWAKKEWRFILKN